MPYNTEILRNAASRASCFQRCHEVARVRQLLAETTSAEVTSQMLYDAYRENLGAGRALSYFKTVSAVLRKMFAVPEIYSVLFEADSLQGLHMGGNVLDSHTRLQTILVKAGDNVGHRIWAAEGLLYMAKRLGKDGRGRDFRRRTSSFCDILIFKHWLKSQLFHRAITLRADDLLLNTDVPFAQWLEQDVEPRMKSHKAWAQAEASGSLTRRAGRTPSEIRWLSLVEDTVFGTLWDALLLSELPADALTRGPLAEQLAAIGGLHRAEQAVATEAATTSVDDSLAVGSPKVRHLAL